MSSLRAIQASSAASRWARRSTSRCRRAPFELTFEVLHAVVDARQLPRVADAQVASLRGGVLDHRDPFTASRDIPRVLPLEEVLHGDMAGVARGAAGIAHGHHEVAVVEPGGRYGEVVRRLVGHVVRRMVRRFARRRDIRAVEGEVARVPRPAPIVDVAAVAADGVRRCVDEAQVADFEVLDQLVLQTPEEAAHPAPMTRVGLAFLHDGLASVFHRLVPGAGRKRGIETTGNPLRDVLGVDRHEDPGTRRRREFLRHGRRQESLFEVVAVRFRVELD